MFHFDDVRYAVRLLRRSPMFTLFTVVVLAGGLGLSIFTFSFLYTAMVKPLPLIDGERIVRVQQVSAGSPRSFDAADLALMRPAIRTLTGVGAFTSRTYVLGEGEHRRAVGATATDYNLFEVTRTRPALGRPLLPADQLPGAEPVIVLNHRIWRAVFASDPAILNQHILLNGTRTRVVGVMPEGFGFPVASEGWVPLEPEVLSTTTPGVYTLEVYARLADHASVEEATTELQLLLDRARSSRPRVADSRLAPAGIAVRAFPIAQFDNQGPLVFSVLNLLSTLILLLACVNVINLLLARANERARETAVRQALGASRARLVLQGMWETVLLCLVGGTLATVLAAWGLDAINNWAQRNLVENLAFWWVWRIDRAALIAAGVFVTITMAVLGGVVSARTTGTRITELLREGGVRSGGRREGRVSRVLVMTQVATVTVLMFFGVLSGIVARRVVTIDPGYNTHNLLSSSISLTDAPNESQDRSGAFFQRVADDLGKTPAVEQIMLRYNIADINSQAGQFQYRAGTADAAASTHRTHVHAILGDPATLGVRTLAGRWFERSDDERAGRVAIVSKALADLHWPGQSPIGQQIRLSGNGETEWRTVVGVSSNLLLGNPLSRNRSAVAVYVPLRQVSAPYAVAFFRHRGNATAAQAALYQILEEADPRILPSYVSTYQEILAKSSLLARSVAALFGACFAFALLLAVSGTYSLMARSIGRRLREIGIRRALGATDRNITRLLLSQGSCQLGMGVLVAAPLMLIVAFGFWRFFPISLGLSLGSATLVCAAIVSMVLLATYVPTRRALRVGPRDAINQD